MITLTARIEILNSDGTISNGSINIPNLSDSGDFSDIVGDKKSGSKPFILGVSSLGGGDVFSKTVEYYIGSINSNNNGIFSTAYSITINGTDITSLTFEFDTISYQFPTSIQIDGVTYQNNSTIFTVNDLQSENSHIIIINNWNTPNYPLRLQGIYSEISIKVDNRNMINIERSIFDRSDIKFPSWGIIANSGNIDFNDLNGEVKDYIEQQLLKSDLAVYFEITNTLVQNKKEQVGKFATDKWNYDNNNRVISVSLKDDLLKWQDILVTEMQLQEEITMKQLYDYLVSLSIGYEFEPLDLDTLSILTSTICEYPYLKSGSLWNEWTKLCVTCCLYVYKNNNNSVVTSSEFGS